MSFNLTINFDKFEDLELFVNDINKYRNWKSKQEIKKKNQIKEPSELNDDLVDALKTDDKRGLHQQHYHNEAKIYQSEHPEMSYRDCLKFIYSHKINKNI
jgi:hypothetical protein